MNDLTFFQRFAAMLISTTACLAGLVTTTCPPGCSAGRWSNDAVDLSSRHVKAPYEDRDILVDAPNHEESFHVVNDHWWVELRGTRISVDSEGSELLYPAEIAWASNARAFFITRSAGFTTGFRTEVYQIVGEKLVLVTRPNEIVEKDFNRRHRCSNGQIGNAPNIAGLKWIDASNELIIVAEVAPLGICKEATYFGGYEVSIKSGKIMERFSPQMLVDNWGDALGARLKSDFDGLPLAERSVVP